MKKILILLTIIFSVFFTFSIQTQADEIYVYPFDSIRITSAFKFEILVEEEPLEPSILFGQVAAGENITIYVGYLEFIFEGQPSSGSGSMMIVTNQDGVDIAAWLINSGSSDLETFQSESYASWITIDPNVGVIKDFTGLTVEIGYKKNMITDQYTFFDNTNKEYSMVVDSFVLELDLDILISAYVEEATS